MTVNVGLVGFGIAGRVFHAALIATTPELRLAAIVQRRGDEAKRAYPEAMLLTSVDALLSDAAIDLVVIATPNASHFELARAALAAGKHVVVDKPFTVSVAEADQLIATAQREDRLLSVFHNRRWDADFLTLQRVISAGMLGRVVNYEAHFDRFRPALKAGAWREQDAPGAGILYDLGSHLIDQALCLFGRPQRVRGDLMRERDGAHADDAFALQLSYEGLAVTLKASMLVREPGPQFIVHGTRGSFLKHRHEPQEDALRRGELPTRADWGREQEAQWGRLETEVDGLHFSGRIESLPGCYSCYYRNVAAALQEGAELAVKPEQARDVIRIIELARSSHAEGRTLDANFDAKDVHC